VGVYRRGSRAVSDAKEGIKNEGREGEGTNLVSRGGESLLSIPFEGVV